MLILLNAYQAVRNGAVIRNAKSFYPSYKGSRFTKAIGPINLMKLLSLAMELVLMFLLNFLTTRLLSILNGCGIDIPQYCLF